MTRGNARRAIAVLVLLLAWRPAAAVNHVIGLAEVLGSWEGDDRVQFIELRLLAAGQTQLAAGSLLIFDTASGDPDARRILFFSRNVNNGVQGARVLIATQALAELAGVQPDFLLTPGVLQPRAGRVCYGVDTLSGPMVIDCVAYGAFEGDRDRFGPPTPVTPDNRSLERVQLSGRNRDDWVGNLRPTPENNAGQSFTFPTRCGDGLLSQGEDCDGSMLGEATCASLGYARGRLACAQCHYDVSRCTSCGNGAITGDEQCDGDDLGGHTCEDLGFTGGTLACTDDCEITTRDCDPTYFVPGGGPRGPECFAAWRVTNAGGRPGANGRAPVLQRCKDGDGGCDGDAVDGTCTLSVALCFARRDARLARGAQPCRIEPIESWDLRSPPLEDNPDLVPLVAAVGALGASTTAGAVVTFAPPLTAVERCTAPVAITVTRRGGGQGARVLRARAVAAGGRPRDVDRLKLVCLP